MASYSKLANWHKALYWIETATPCVRQYARLVNHKKKELDARYHYDNTASIQEAVQRLPAGRCIALDCSWVLSMLLSVQTSP